MTPVQHTRFPAKTKPIDAPLGLREMITDDDLRELAQIEPGQASGELSQRRQELLSMILPDFCGELLARRRCMAGSGGTDQLGPLDLCLELQHAQALRSIEALEGLRAELSRRLVGMCQQRDEALDRIRHLETIVRSLGVGTSVVDFETAKADL